MHYVLSSLVFCLAITGCAQKAGGNISTNVENTANTNFQLNSATGQQELSNGNNGNNQADSAKGGQ